MDPQIRARAAAVLASHRARGMHLATAESCTGGLVAAALTDIPGSSDVVERGFVVYSNEAKTDLLGVSADLLREHGAVSAPVACAMAEGGLARSRADAVVAVTGVAGPGGGSEAKPVGLVHLALAARGRPVQHLERRYGALERAEIRRLAVLDALELLADAPGVYLA
jgi:nicotinamide-nucleotide amidase